VKHLYYQILLGLREETLFLEKLLFPSTKLVDPGNRYLRWTFIFSILHDHPIVSALIKCILKNGLPLDEFAKQMQKLYGDDSGLVHGVRLPDIPVEEMIKILTTYERKPNPYEKKLLTVLLKSSGIIESTMEKYKEPITGTLYLVLICYAQRNNVFNRYIDLFGRCK
jgi:hypothetical protein